MEPGSAGICRPDDARRHDRWRCPEVTSPGHGERWHRRVVRQCHQSVIAGDEDVWRRIGRPAKCHSAITYVGTEGLASDPAEVVDADDIAHALLADDKRIPAAQQERPDRSEVDIVAVVVVPVRFGECVEDRQCGRQAQNALPLVWRG